MSVKFSMVVRCELLIITGRSFVNTGGRVLSTTNMS